MIFNLLGELALIFNKPKDFTLLPKLESKKKEITSLALILQLFAWPADRKKTLEDYELSFDLIKPWLVCADLCRIKGISPEVAQVLALEGYVDSVQSLAKANKTTLTAKLVKVFESHGLVSPPTEAQVGKLIARAQKMHARVVWNSTDNREFKAILQGYYYRHLYLDLYDTINILRIIFAVLLALFIFYCFIAGCLLLIGPVAEKPLYLLGVVNVVAIGIELTLLVLFNFSYHYYLFWFTEVYLPQRLARDRNTKLVFITDLNRDMDWVYAVSQKVVAPLMMIVAMILLVLIIFLREFLLEKFNTYLFYFVLSIILLILILFVPYSFFRMKKELPIRHLPPRALTKFMLQKLVSLVKYFLQFAIFYFTVLGLLIFHQFFSSSILAPLYGDPARAIEYFGSYSLQTWHLDIGNIIIQLLIWSIGLIAVLFFLVPYLLLRKPKEVLLFLLLTLAANRTENFLTNNLGGFVNIPSGTIFAAIMVIGAILFNAAVFETLEEASDDIEEGKRLKLCKACFKYVPLDVSYCPYCGKNDFQDGTEIAQILALGVKGLTNEMALDLIEKYGNVGVLRKCTTADFETIEGIGPQRAEALHDSLRV